MHNAAISHDDAVKAFAKLGVASGDNVLSWASGQTENTMLKDGHTLEVWFNDAVGNRNHTVRSVVEITPAANRQ